MTFRRQPSGLNMVTLEFFLCPLDLQNSPTPFIELMNKLFKQYLYMFFIILIYDILINSQSEGEYADHLRIVLQMLKYHLLFATFSKCEFLLGSIAFHGHIFSRMGIHVYPKKTKAFKNEPRPHYSSYIRSVYCFNNYFN